MLQAFSLTVLHHRLNYPPTRRFNLPPPSMPSRPTKKTRLPKGNGERQRQMRDDIELVDDPEATSATALRTRRRTDSR